MKNALVDILATIMILFMVIFFGYLYLDWKSKQPITQNVVPTMNVSVQSQPLSFEVASKKTE